MSANKTGALRSGAANRRRPRHIGDVLTDHISRRADGSRILSEESFSFRKLLADALYTTDAIGYLDADRFIGRCPVCGDHVGVRFHGYAPRATLTCHGGCSEGDIGARIGDRVRLR